MLTDEAFERMIALAERFTGGVQALARPRRCRGTSCSSGARAEYRFCPEPPRSGGRGGGGRRRASWTRYLHLFLLNRGVLITPFHNMALMCPAHGRADVDRHTEVFAEAVDELVGSNHG